MTKLLITGANGFIGRALFNRLLDDKANVYGGVRHATTADNFVKTPTLGASEEWGAVLEGFEIVVHTAGRAHILKEKSNKPLEVFRAINTAGTIKLAEDCAAAGVKRFIFISSIGVHGERSIKPFTESDIPQPFEDYAISKLEAEHGVLEVGRQSGMEIVIIRPPLVYGADAPGNFSLLFKSILKRLPLPLGVFTFNKRTFIGIDNLVDLLVRCIYHPNASSQIFLAADNETVSTAEFIEEIGIAFGIRVMNIKVPYSVVKFFFTIIGKANIINKLALSLEISNRKALDMLDWSPPYTMREGLQKMSGFVRDDFKK